MPGWWPSSSNPWSIRQFHYRWSNLTLAYGTQPRTSTLKARLHQIGGKAVRVTEVRIPDGSDLVERLTDMRVWLDEHRYEPSTFTYFFLPSGMKIRVSFRVENEAKEFAERFDGFLLDLIEGDRSPSDSLALRDGQPPLKSEPWLDYDAGQTRREANCTPVEFDVSSSKVLKPRTLEWRGRVGVLDRSQGGLLWDE